MTFQPGKSGNPSGRPRGIIDKRAKLRSLLESHGQEIVEALIENAKDGDPDALRLCVERLIPRVKPEAGIVFELPEGRLDALDNILEIVHRVTQAVVSGQMTIEEADKFNAFLNSQRWLIEQAEIKLQNEIESEE